MPVCLIGLGSNQGDRRATLTAAIARLAAMPQTRIVAQSEWRETTPIGGPLGQGPFLNGAAKLETSLPPLELLGQLQQIESEFGRQRSQRWAARTLDLDLLLYDDCILDTPTLTLPHPRMAWRRFVLEPVAEVAGSMLHPTTGWSVARLLRHLNDSRPYAAVTGPIGVGKTHLAERLAAALSGLWIAERPDWPRLDAFYADPSRYGLEMELKFLRQRAELLDERHGQLAAATPKQWGVSDFWFDQSAAFARAWLVDEPFGLFRGEYERLRPTVVRPRLVIALDLPAEELVARIARRGRPCERRLDAEPLERIRRAVLETTRRPDVGPVLRLDGGDAETVLADSLAAVRGTE